MDNAVGDFLTVIVGHGSGNGMAVMFLMTGIAGFLISIFSHRKREIRELDI